MATPNYDIDYNDKRFTQVENDKKTALNEVDVTYGKMIGDADSYYQKQIDAAKEYGETQKKNQQQQTDFAIEKIEQQKEQTHKDYIKEQSGAYVDWQKQSNPYGVEAERQAEAGLAGSGYSESSQVSMYNTYQNRVMTAREVYNQAVLNYDNAIKDAQLQNNSLLAEIAYNSLQQQLQLSLEGFQYKNSLVLEKAKEKRAVNESYYKRYQDVLAQINHENALAEQVRQYNEDLAFKKEQEANDKAYQQQQIKLAQQELQLQKDKFAYEKSQDSKQTYTSGKSGSSGSGGSSKSSKGSKPSNYTSKKGSTTTTSSKTKAKSSAKQKVKVDMNSVLALGLGPISESKLDSLVSNGYVKEYVKNGVVSFTWTAKGIKQKSVYSSLG